MNEQLLNKLSDFAMIFIGLAVESMPFVVIGVTVSTLIAKYASSSWILNHKSQNRFVSHIQSMFIGLFLPVCECGNIPLAKRLSIIGFKPSEVITFMLAAPIFNPLVLITTLVAFNLDPNVAIIRVLAGAGIALLVGLIFSLHYEQSELMVETETGQSQLIQPKKNFSFNESLVLKTESQDQGHDGSLVDNFRDEFFNVFKMLVIGCFLAALFQILIPRDIFSNFAGSPSLSVIALMGLAFVISICSSIDAFFALSLAGVFNLGSIIAFLVFGPMIDIKSLMMLRTIFTVKTLITMTIIVALLCLITGLSVNYYYKLNYL
jgi:uncharacterized protein